MATRYDASGVQAEFEPGSRGKVLRNRLGITRLRDIQQAESQALQLAQARAIETFSADQRFAAADVCRLHRLWLGPIYAWAGEYRTVNLGKGGLPPLDFSPLDGRGKRRYIAGVQAAMDRDYRLLTEMFGKVIGRTWKSVSSSGR